MTFIKLSVTTTPEFGEIYIAELSAIGFDTFEETETGIEAYLPKESFDEAAVKEIIDRYSAMTETSYSFSEVEKQNWNEEWEKNYHPIEVEGKCRVRATFHEADPSFKYEIVIIPKMSFGTGHHATTYNMLSLEMEHDFQGKTVVDLGTGTGVLAIMAHKLGASHIEVTDVDDWCIENSTENMGLNDIENAPAHLGPISEITLSKPKYDVVLANINKNVLLAEMKHYAALLDTGGTLFLSGFYEPDVEDIKNKAKEYNLSIDSRVIKDNWAALKLIKS